MSYRSLMLILFLLNLARCGESGTEETETAPTITDEVANEPTEASDSPENNNQVTDDGDTVPDGTTDSFDEGEKEVPDDEVHISGDLLEALSLTSDPDDEVDTIIAVDADSNETTVR
ncbi:MAG: hypothetical protein HRU09_14095 [Oligoflexales bacterium]|nr:hypothetical protein [Oligoflexales bacterium]